MPYRIDIDDPPDHTFDTLVDLGALDVEYTAGALAALMPDAVASTTVARALGIAVVAVSAAVGRDDDSVWTLSARPVRVRTLLILPAGSAAVPGALRLADREAFGTGLHPTTALCLEAIEDLPESAIPARVLDIGTGSGVLALAALRRGVQRAVGLDVDSQAVESAAENARLNGLADRLSVVRGGPDAVRGSWPLVVANIRAADLIEMAPSIVRRIASRGRLVLSGIPSAVAGDVERTYRRLGLTRISVDARRGWSLLVLSAGW